MQCTAVWCIQGGASWGAQRVAAQRRWYLQLLPTLLCGMQKSCWVHLAACFGRHTSAPPGRPGRAGGAGGGAAALPPRAGQRRGDAAALARHRTAARPATLQPCHWRVCAHVWHVRHACAGRAGGAALLHALPVQSAKGALCTAPSPVLVHSVCRRELLLCCGLHCLNFAKPNQSLSPASQQQAQLPHYTAVQAAAAADLAVAWREKVLQKQGDVEGQQYNFPLQG